MSETAGHGQWPLHGRLQTAVNLTNVSALLWRLDTLGCDIGDRWRELAALWQGHADGKCLVFGDIHAAMAELRSGEASAVERRLEAMRETAASGVEAAGLYRTVGIPVVEGLAAFHRGAYGEAVKLLLPVRFDLWQIGGSHAQRDVVNWTLTEAALRAGQRDVALSLAHERLGTVRGAPQTAAFSAMPRASWGDRPWCAGFSACDTRRGHPRMGSTR